MPYPASKYLIYDLFTIPLILPSRSPDLSVSLVENAGDEARMEVIHLQEGLDKLKNEMAELKGEMTELKGEMAELKAEMVELKKNNFWARDHVSFSLHW